MKKLATLYLACMASVAFAQSTDSTKTEKTDTLKANKKESVKSPEVNPQVAALNEYKVNAGNFTTELNVNLFQGSLSFNNALQQIKVRYFTKNNFAYRFALNFNSHSTSDGSSSPYGTNPINYQDDKKTTTIGLGFGFEKHFVGTSRLSPYIGAELSLVNKSASETITNNSTVTSIDGAWSSSTTTFIPNYGYVTYSSYSERAFFRYGVNLIGGFDYYISKHFFFGYEFTFQYYSTDYKNIDVTTTGQSSNNSTPTQKSSEMFIGPNLINGVRLGFVF